MICYGQGHKLSSFSSVLFSSLVTITFNLKASNCFKPVGNENSCLQVIEPGALVHFNSLHFAEEAGDSLC